jgi:hypothetical protein
MLLWMLISCVLNSSLYEQRSEELAQSQDSDGDGHPASSDCDDDNAEVFPGARELCDALDNDCDGEIDEEATDTSIWYVDGDGDGYGQSGSEYQVQGCDQPAGTSAEGQDCDDADSDIHPGATETWYDGVDSDCGGDSDYDADLDGQDSEDWAGEDCDDTDSTTYAGAEEEWWDAGIDNDCDGDVDDAATLDLAEFTPLTGLEEGDHLGSTLLQLPPDWSGTEPMLLVAAPGAIDNQGTVYALGASEILDMESLDEAEWILSGAWDDQSLGAAMSWIGDSSSPLFVAAAPAEEDSRVYIFNGPLVDTDPEAPSIEMDGEDVPGLGRSLASGHDHDGDGLADLVMSRGQLDGTPEAVLIFFEPDRLPGSLNVDDADVMLLLDASSGRVGLTALGDADSDGSDDLGIGITSSDGTAPGGMILSWAREAGTYDMVAESSLVFSGDMVRLAPPVDVDGDGSKELLAGPDQLYRFSLPLPTGTVDWTDAEAMATLSDFETPITSVQSNVPDLGGLSRIGVLASQASDARGQVFLTDPGWSGEMTLGSTGLWLEGESPGDGLGTSLVFFEAFGDSEIGLIIGAPGLDESGGKAAEDAGAIYRVPSP